MNIAPRKIVIKYHATGFRPIFTDNFSCGN